MRQYLRLFYSRQTYSLKFFPFLVKNSCTLKKMGVLYIDVKCPLRILKGNNGKREDFYYEVEQKYGSGILYYDDVVHPEGRCSHFFRNYSSPFA
ncbi:hypothetical protein LM601598_80005 [Listeria monocytogenes]|nr:hypothetical protein LM601598_80005 [Listeria monocytogenes]